jgi:prepilin-type N-terminal cleavage/methylation domain-containing protein
MTFSGTTRSAFTLIELMIALALGTLICYAAFSGIRTASQATTVCQRLALENQLLRTGILQGLEDADFWTSFDTIEPVGGAADKRRLRSPGPSASGANPFRPLALDVDFDLAKPKTWFTSIAACARHEMNAYGRDAEILQRVGHPDPVAAWLPTNFEAIANTLGYYALIDYLPPNQPFAFNDRGATKHREFSRQGEGMYVAPAFNAGYGVYGLGHLTHHTVFGITYPSSGDDLLRVCNQSGFTDYAFGRRTKEFHDRGPVNEPVIEVKPTAWPACRYQTRRFVGDMTSVCLVDVLVTSALTGQTIKAQFMCQATTLRGARQQRGLDRHIDGLTTRPGPTAPVPR